MEAIFRATESDGIREIFEYIHRGTTYRARIFRSFFRARRGIRSKLMEAFFTTILLKAIFRVKAEVVSFRIAFRA